MKRENRNQIKAALETALRVEGRGDGYYMTMCEALHCLDDEPDVPASNDRPAIDVTWPEHFGRDEKGRALSADAFVALANRRGSGSA